MGALVRVIVWELVPLLAQFLLGNSYPRGALPHGLLLLTTLAAATTFLYVLMALKSAQAKAAAACKQCRCVASVSVGWKLRVLLLLAIALSAASTFLAVPAFEDGYRYHSIAVATMVIMTANHVLAALLVALAVLDQALAS